MINRKWHTWCLHSIMHTVNTPWSKTLVPEWDDSTLVKGEHIPLTSEDPFEMQGFKDTNKGLSNRQSEPRSILCERVSTMRTFKAVWNGPCPRSQTRETRWKPAARGSRSRHRAAWYRRREIVLERSSAAWKGRAFMLTIIERRRRRLMGSKKWGGTKMTSIYDAYVWTINNDDDNDDDMMMLLHDE
jgi:hypothetical protein